MAEDGKQVEGGGWWSGWRWTVDDGKCMDSGGWWTMASTQTVNSNVDGASAWMVVDGEAGRGDDGKCVASEQQH